MVFPGVQKSTWSYDSVAREWYFHRFYNFQPDLNTLNPAVQSEILKIMGFWIQLGVSGFRMDAGSGQTRRINSTIAASEGDWRQCWAATGVGLSSPTA